MILFDLFASENNAVYQKLQIANLDRQYDFLRSIVDASLEAGRPFLSQTLIKAFNYHALVCLHSYAGEFRPCEVSVSDHTPPMWIHVQAQMDDLVNSVNYNWEKSDPVSLAAYVLWRMCWIHPFVNGNGRTARLTAYYIICVKAGGMLGGNTSLPELLRRRRHQNDDPYLAALVEADASFKDGELNLSALHKLMTELLTEQLASAEGYVHD